MFDLQSLATLATARALEMGSQEGNSTSSGRHFPARRILNLRRKCSWTPRNEPVNFQMQHPLSICGYYAILVWNREFFLVRITTNCIRYRYALQKVAWKQLMVLSLQCVSS